MVFFGLNGVGAKFEKIKWCYGDYPYNLSFITGRESLLLRKL
jgi:hypothetical protein